MIPFSVLTPIFTSNITKHYIVCQTLHSCAASQTRSMTLLVTSSTVNHVTIEIFYRHLLVSIYQLASDVYLSMYSVVTYPP